jgi:hypothetical protein
MTFLVLAVAALICLAVALLLLRSLGVRYRVGRLLAAAPLVDIEAARQLAASEARYVRVNGRIKSDEEFPDENDRPLVYRRKRIEIADVRRRGGRGGPGGWRTLADEREAVPFGVETRGAFIAVDENAIDDGLVAIPRESTGTLADLPADLLEGAADLPAPDAPARLVIEQLSAVEHATVCGTPFLRDGQPTMTAGLGRPLIVTILDQPSAMRLLASGYRRRVIAAASLIAIAAILSLAAAVAVFAGL